MNRDPIGGLVTLVVIAGVVVWLLYACGQQKDCEARHGVLVKGWWGMECVEEAPR